MGGEVVEGMCVMWTLLRREKERKAGGGREGRKQNVNKSQCYQEKKRENLKNVFFLSIQVYFATDIIFLLIYIDKKTDKKFHNNSPQTAVLGPVSRLYHTFF